MNLTGFLQATVDPSTKQKQILDLSSTLRNTAAFFSTFTGLGVICILIRIGWVSSAATPLLWALECLAAGAAVGFLFGIPKILQGNTLAVGGVADASAGASASTVTTPAPAKSLYQQRVNTNLEEISDWLTKIIVGLGLINLAKIPLKLQSLADLLAGEMHPPNQRAFALSLIIYFAITGFLYGYLFTRLFLQRAFALSDLSALTLTASELSEKVDLLAQQALAANPQAGKGPTKEQVQAAEQVAQVTSQNDFSVVQQQINALAREYEAVRGSMPPGDERTRKMEVVVTKMRTLAIVGQPLLPQLMKSSSPGQRLAAIAILQVRPDPAYLEWLEGRLGQERPFVGYHAAVALLTAVRTLDKSYRSRLAEAIRKAKEAVAPEGQDTDRMNTLNQAEKELPPG
jgi:hypothetical protein